MLTGGSCCHAVITISAITTCLIFNTFATKAEYFTIIGFECHIGWLIRFIALDVYAAQQSLPGNTSASLQPRINASRAKCHACNKHVSSEQQVGRWVGGSPTPGG